MSYMNSLIVLGEVVAQVVETLGTNNKAHLAFTIKLHQGMTLGSNHFEN